MINLLKSLISCIINADKQQSEVKGMNNDKSSIIGSDN